MHVLAIAGLIGSGKDTAAEILGQRGFAVIDYAQILRALLRNEGLEITRESLQEFRQDHGKEFLAREAVKRISSRKTVITPMRVKEDFLIPKEKFNARLAWIEASPEARFQRIRGRGRENDPKTLDAFLAQERRERELFDFEWLRKHADFLVRNEGSRAELERGIKKIL